MDTRRHAELTAAFEAIDDKNALAWSVVTGKSELAVTQAIALTANRSAVRLVASPEFKRMDLVLLRDIEGPIDARIFAAYQAKAAFLGDYRQDRIVRSDRWLGKLLNDDFQKLEAFATSRRLDTGACLFYLYELSDPSRHVKYSNADHVPIKQALAFVSDQVRGRKVCGLHIDCGEAHGTRVKIHLLVFEPVVDDVAPS